MGKSRVIRIREEEYEALRRTKRDVRTTLGIELTDANAFKVLLGKRRKR